ncbi:UPF0568 protein [Diplonema papillatum]|nr:UPF0568 protein [Diplonema papillatum]
MSRLEIKLKALGYPYGWSDQEMSIAKLREMMIWLEDTKVRWMSPAERIPLKSVNEAQWVSAFQSYCKAVGYNAKFPFSPGEDIANNKELRSMVEWIVGKAIRLSYADEADRYNKAHEKYRYMGMSNITKVQETEVGEVVTYDISDEEGMKTIADDILRELNLPVPEELEKAVFVIARAIHDAVMFTDHKRKIDPPSVDELLATLPSEHTKRPETEKVLKILRTLFVADLKELQNRVSSILCELQAATANIKTDIGAGKVGI